MNKLRPIGPIILIFFVFGCAGARGYSDQGSPADLPLITGNKTALTEQAPAPSSALAGMMTRQTRAINNLASAVNRLIEGRKGIAGSGQAAPETAPAAAEKPRLGKPEAGVFSRYAGEVKTVTPAPPAEEKNNGEDKEAAHRQLREFRQDNNAFGSLKDRVSRLEEIFEVYHPGSDAGFVRFQPASAYLDPAAIGWLDKKIDRWFKGEIDILAVNGYASTDKPKKHGMTNMDYARGRAEAVAAYLKSRGVKTDGIKINTKGETSRFSDNMNVTLVWEEVGDRNGQDRRKEKRGKYGTP